MFSAISLLLCARAVVVSTLRTANPGRRDPRNGVIRHGPFRRLHPTERRKRSKAWHARGAPCESHLMGLPALRDAGLSEGRRAVVAGRAPTTVWCFGTATTSGRRWWRAHRALPRDQADE